MDDLNRLYSSGNFVNEVDPDPDHVNFIDLSSIGRMVAEEVVVVE